MSWKFEKVHEIAAGGNCMAFDGKYIWTVSGTSVKVIDFWGPDKLNEQEYDQLNDPLWATKLTQVGTYTISGAGVQIVYGMNMMFIMQSSMQMITKINTLTGIITDIPLPETMDSNIAYHDGKIWVSSLVGSSSSQYLYNIDCLTDVVSVGAGIPTQKQSSVRRAIVGCNAFVYVTNYNDASVSKFSSSTGLFVSTIFGNGQPIGIFVNKDGLIWVSSFSGMLSSIDPATDIFTNLYGTTAPTTKLVDDGLNFWVLGTANPLLRIRKSDKHMIIGTFSANVDYHMAMNQFTSYPFNDLLLTPEFTYEQYDNASQLLTVQMKQYVFLLGSTKLMCFRKHKYLNRGYSSSLKALSMISSGPYDFTGE